MFVNTFFFLLLQFIKYNRFDLVNFVMNFFDQMLESGAVSDQGFAFWAFKILYSTNTILLRLNPAFQCCCFNSMIAVKELDESCIWFTFTSKEDFKSFFIMSIATFFSTHFWTSFSAKAYAIMSTIQFFLARLLTRFSIADFKALLAAF